MSSGPTLKKIKTNSLESRFGLLEHDSQDQSEKPTQQEDLNPLLKRFQDPKPHTESKGLLEKRATLGSDTETPKQYETPAKPEKEKFEETTPLEQLAQSRAEQNGKQEKNEKPKTIQKKYRESRYD